MNAFSVAGRGCDQWPRLVHQGDKHTTTTAMPSSRLRLHALAASSIDAPGRFKWSEHL